MGIFDDHGARTGSLVAAAMESAGIDIQADMLVWVQSDSGMLLAGLLYLLAIVSAVFSIAQGGTFLWGRYLLVGPALFLFLTQTTEQADGSKWVFADHEFSEEHVQRALRDTGYDGRGDVSLFFKFWNNFISDSVQELMGLLNLTQDGSHLDFMTKMERYMNLWIDGSIKDHNLQQFVRLVMMNECASYFSHLMAVADPHIDPVTKSLYQTRIDEMKNVAVFTVSPEAPQRGTPMEKWLVEKAALQPNNSYTCDQLWKAAVSVLVPMGEDKVQQVLSANLNADQTAAQTTAKLLKKIGTETNPLTMRTRLQEGQLLQAVHWLVARSLWQEMTDTNAVREYYANESHSGYFASSPTNGALPFQASGASTSSAIRQFNRNFTFQFKADFVNAALSMPHFQGLALLLLSASFPFFAMAMILPGRAGAILTWMGLWAWVKLWDLGFAVVMLIDNIMYTLFPRGPVISGTDLQNPGVSFRKLMEMDPSYNSATYYNMIAVCLYAVPIVTGVFVKGAGSGFVGMVRDAWQAHSTRLAGSAFSYARALQGQGYVRDQRIAELKATNQALWDTRNSTAFKEDEQQWLALRAASAGVDGLKFLSGQQKENLLRGLTSGRIGFSRERANQLLGGVGTAAGAFADGEQAKLKALMAQKENEMTTALAASASLAAYQYSAGPGGWFAAESANAAGFYSHDTNVGYPSDQLFSAMAAQRYLNQESISSAYGDGFSQAAGNIFSNLFPAGGRARTR